MTPPSEQTLDLAGEFPEATRDQWRELVAGVLRKSGRLPEDHAGPVEDLLATTVADGVRVAPLYTVEDAHDAGVPGLAPFVRGGRALGAHPDGWDVRARHADPDPATTAEAALVDLAGGVRSLWLVFGEGALPTDALPQVLAEVPLDVTPVALDAGTETRAVAEALFALAEDRGLSPEQLAGNLGADPIGLLATADADYDVEAGLREAGELAARCRRDRPNLRAVTVNATGFHSAGADAAQELGYALAAGVAYLRTLTAADGAGLSAADALDQLEFRYAATADQFTTIAKLRAARGLWSRVAAECGARGHGAQRQHAVSSELMITARDPWVNMLRGTLACFGAGVAGADAVTVLPFDAALGLPDSFSRRIARNTQALLIDESHLARVVDPAGGSWYVEQLTDALARRGWEVFTGLEAAGGLVAGLRDGSVAGTLADTWRRREHRLATRKEPITGVSEFPNLAERLPERPPDRRPPNRGALPRVRAAAAFEALRDRADAHERETGTRPAVFLARLGSPASYTARAAFAANLFQAGGIQTPTGDGDAEQIGSAFGESGARIACLCAAEQAYAETGAEVAEALRAAGAAKVLLAGKPGTLDGVDGHVFAGCDAVEVLTETLHELGVS